MIVSFILQIWMASSLISPHTRWFCLGVFSKTRKLAALREIEMITGIERRNPQKLFNLSYFCQRILQRYFAVTFSNQIHLPTVTIFSPSITWTFSAGKTWRKNYILIRELISSMVTEFYIGHEVKTQIKVLIGVSCDLMALESWFYNIWFSDETKWTVAHLSDHLQLQGVIREILHSLVEPGETVGGEWDSPHDDAVYLRHRFSSRNKDFKYFSQWNLL